MIFWGAAQSLEESRTRLSTFLARGAGQPAPVGWHAVVERSSGEIVGNVVLQPAPFLPGELEIGWHVRYDRWGRGYATEAARALRDAAFERLAPARLVCAILPTNERSQRVAARLGFTRLAQGVLHAGLAHDLFERRADAQARRT